MFQDNSTQEAIDKTPGWKGTWKWLLIGLAVIILAAVGFLFLKKPAENGGGGGGGTPKLIQADFIDLSKIYTISKFRSGSGHDFSQRSGETCRSMKHYFNSQMTQESENARSRNNGIPPAPDGVNDISIFSPVDGKITGIQADQMPTGEQIYITPDSDNSYLIRLFHIYKDSGIKKGSKVKAGQKIGKISQYSNTDIAIVKRSITSEQYFSYFEAMPDEIFAKYLARGAKSRDDFIITKEYRDANPLQCNGEQFAVNYDSDPNSGNFVYLSGYLGSSYQNNGNNSDGVNQKGDNY